MKARDRKERIWMDMMEERKRERKEGR